MVKTILYTSNPSVNVSSIEDVENFAIDNEKFMVCYANEDSANFELKAGAHVFTAKGNNVWILKVSKGKSKYDAKACNITDIVEIDYPFGEYEDEDVLDPTAIILATRNR